MNYSADALELEYETTLTHNITNLMFLRYLLVSCDKYKKMNEVPLGLYQNITKSLYITSRSLGLPLVDLESRSVLLYTSSIVCYLVIRKIIKQHEHEIRNNTVYKTQRGKL